MALRRRARAAVLAPPAPSPAPPADDAWTAEPGLAPVALEERPGDEPGVWVAAAEPIDVTDATIDMPALAPMPRRRAHGPVARHSRSRSPSAARSRRPASCGPSPRRARHPPSANRRSSPPRAPHRAKPAHHRRVVHRHRRGTTPPATRPRSLRAGSWPPRRRTPLPRAAAPVRRPRPPRQQPGAGPQACSQARRVHARPPRTAAVRQRAVRRARPPAPPPSP